MEFLMTLFYILLFVVFLSILIMVHEAGHLVAAKAFNVYCFEYSIGFGPKLFSKKRKNGETAFSIRAIPLGGYVSMYGEAETLPEGMVIDEKRSLMKIKRWKRCIVLIAGVTMNALISIVIFFIAESACQQYRFIASQAVVKEESIAYQAGLRDDDTINFLESYSEEYPDYFVVDDNAVIEEDNQRVAACLTRSLTSKSDDSWQDHLFFVKVDDDKVVISSEKQISIETMAKEEKHFAFTIYAEDSASKAKEVKIRIAALRTATNYYLEDCGIKFYRKDFHNNFGQAFEATFQDFGSSSTAIFRGLGSLFSGKEEVGGIVAVGFTTSNALKNFGVYTFLVMWGMISVNLAIVNLLPFPGLDGWQLLVTIIEGVTHKEIPDKVKGIISLVGIGILLVLMIGLIIKDLIMFVF